MHGEAMQWVENCRKKFSISSTDKVLEIGSYNHNGTVRNLFVGCEAYVGVDIIPGPCVDIVGNINDMEFSKYLTNLYGGFDIVVSTETLEHTPWRPLLTSMVKLLDFNKPLVNLIVTCAGVLRPVHSFDGGPLKPDEYYSNVGPDELKEYTENLLADLCGSKSSYKVEVATNEFNSDTYLFVEVEKCE